MNEELLLRAVAALEHLANPGLRWGDIIALSVGLVQCSLIAWGLWLMRQGARHRDQQHEETMAALRQQGEVLRSVSEGIREMGEGIRETGEGIREMGEGIREVIARTRPA